MSHSQTARLALHSPRSRFYHGPFGRLFAHLEPWHADDASLEAFARDEMVERPGLSPTDLASNEAERDAVEAEFASGIPAGYTYFGQFVDHDITFDPTPLSSRAQDPDGLHNFRTPRLDLDNVYGRGPDDQPYLYNHPQTAGKQTFLLGKVEGTAFDDLPRNSQGRALIGDMRNDENAMVAQIQLAFLKAHNTLVGQPGFSFDEAKRVLTWLYQWTVVNDFLKRVLDPDVHGKLLSVDAETGKVTAGYGHVYNWKHQPFMPVEFAGAAYRFGHTMVRNAYQTNTQGKFIPIFDNASDEHGNGDLRGDRPLTDERVIHWDLFLELAGAPAGLPQRTHKLDTKLSNALASLPFFGPSDAADNVLAFRNLKRGVALGLPSGPDVARALGLTPVALPKGAPQALWYYILKEAEDAGGERLGKLGSILVASVMAGLLVGDKRSVFNADPRWSPQSDDIFKTVNPAGEAPGLATIIRLSGLPITALATDGGAPAKPPKKPKKPEPIKIGSDN